MTSIRKTFRIVELFMLFNSVLFLVFFLIVYLFFHFSRLSSRKYILLFSSFVFYATWDVLTFNSLIPRFFFHFLGILTLSYFFIYRIENSKTAHERKWNMILGVSLNVLNLVFFKYLYFFTEVLGTLFSHPEWKSELELRVTIILPIAISFYTFQTIAFIVDKYKNEIPEHISYTDFVLFIFFFPQQLAGPILKWKEFLPRLYHPVPITHHYIYMGLLIVGIGIFKKGVLADTLAEIVNPVFANVSAYSGSSHFFASLGFIIQLYCDFSGYSDIAIGCGKLLGFDLPQNFRAPFFSQSFSEMWERWHITLSRFLREYIYFPLGGSRVSLWRANFNTFFTMLIAGLWHGANWNFLIWGAVIGVSLILERLILNKIEFWKSSSRPAVFIRILLTFSFWILLAMIFRVKDISDIRIILNSWITLSEGQSINFELILYTTIIVFGLQFLENKSNYYYERILARKPIFILSLSAIFLLFLLTDVANKQVQFIYFQF